MRLVQTQEWSERMRGAKQDSGILLYLLEAKVQPESAVLL